MKALIASLVIVVCLTLTSWKKNNEKFNGRNTYKAIVIGNQTWMAENLNVITFRNGDTIQEVRTIEEWKAAGKQKKPAWCYNNNDSSNGSIYGKLYNFYAVSDPRGLAPNGWQIPTGNDWFELSDFLGDKKNAGSKLTDFKTNHVTYQSENSADGFGVFSEVWYRGNRDWKAYIDGQYVDHVRANYILRAMKIPAGSHKIEFKFQPVIFATAGMLTNIGSALIALLVLVVLFFEFKKYSKSQE